MSEIKEFIKTNKLSFKEGSRNSSVTPLIGYSLFLGLTKEQLEEELKQQIAKDGFIQDEIDRLWAYCQSRNYQAYWEKPEAKKTWKF